MSCYKLEGTVLEILELIREQGMYQMLIFILERTIELDLPLQSLKVQNMSYPKALFFLQKRRLQQLCLHSSTPGSVLTWMELAEGIGKRRHRKCGADEG